MTDMIHNLPQQYRKDQWVLALVKAIQSELIKQEALLDSVPEQMDLSRMTWLLPVEEAVAGITPRADQSVQERREAVMAQWRMAHGKISADTIQAVCDAWENGEVIVGFTDGKISLDFVGSHGVPSDLTTLQALLETAVPAHLPLLYRFSFLLVSDVSQMTVAQLEEQQIGAFAFNT